jgi:hypothetical protein
VALVDNPQSKFPVPPVTEIFGAEMKAPTMHVMARLELDSSTMPQFDVTAMPTSTAIA